MADITEQGPVWSLVDAQLEVPSGGQVVDVDLFYVRSVQPNPDVNTVTFEGDDTSQDVDEVTKWGVTVICDKHDWEVIQRAFGKTVVTGEEGEEWRIYMADDDEVSGSTVGLRYTMKYKDESVSPVEVGYIGYRWPRGQIKVVQPQQAEWKNKNVVQHNFTFEKATTDAAGVALPSVPTYGAPYYIFKPS